MEQNHSHSIWYNPSNIRPLEDQARSLPNSIVTNHQNLPHRNYFILNGNERNYDRYSSALSIQALEDEILRLRLSSPANYSNNGHTAHGHNFFDHRTIFDYPLLNNGVPNIHAQSSSFRASTMGIGVGYGPVGRRNDHGYPHGRGIGSMRMNNELDFNEILRLFVGGNLSETQIIEVIKDRLHELAVDRDGNSFVQSLLGLCNNVNFINHLLLILTRQEDLFVAVCLDNLGHRVVVKLMDHLRHPHQQSLIALTISCHAVTLAKSARGGHEVLKRCFLKLSPRDNELILLRIAQSCLELARDQAGCCILQVCIEYAKEEVREALVSPLIQDAENLSIHAYGNYVIQFMIKLDGANIGPRIIKVLRNNFVELSMNKYGSNVVEKCLSCCEGYADEIIFEIMENNEDPVQVCSNEYGNYVVQKAISFAKGEAYNLLIEVIKNHRIVLQFNQYGKNVIAAVNRILKKSNSQVF